MIVNGVEIFTSDDFVNSGEFYNKEKGIEIFKSNTLIEGGFDLTSAEHDLMTLAINKIFSQGTGKITFITAKEFAKTNKVHEKYAYSVLKETVSKLQDRKLRIKISQDELRELTKNDEYYTSRLDGSDRKITLETYWVQAAIYEEFSGYVGLVFTDVLSYLIQRTGVSYTKYPYEKTIELKRFHTKRFYELCCKRSGAKPAKGKKYPQLTMTVDDWRELFGCLDKYEKIAEFKRWVLLPSIQEINNQGEFELTLEQTKIGRTITHFTLIIKDCRKQEKPTTSNKYKLSERAANYFGSLLGNNTEFGSNLAKPGESIADFIQRIQKELLDPAQVEKYWEWLIKVGYNSNHSQSKSK